MYASEQFQRCRILLHDRAAGCFAKKKRIEKKNSEPRIADAMAKEVISLEGSKLVAVL